MLCEKCHENQVSFIISISADSGKDTGSLAPTEIRVCEECATGAPEHGIPNMRSGSGTEDRECPQCHSRYSQSRADMDGLLSCSFCYTEFREELIQRIHRIHGSTIHKGKSPVPGAKSKTSPNGGSDGEILRRGDAEIGSKTLAESHRRPFAASLSGGLRTFTDLESGLPVEAEWMQGKGPDCDVVISTRVRLARNISGHAFCNSAKESELRQIAAIVEDAVVNVSERNQAFEKSLSKKESENSILSGKFLRDMSVIKLEHLDAIDREFLVERHLISRDLAERNGTREVIIGANQVVSIMLNEEDHIRLQIINSGLQFRQSWEMISAIDNELGRAMDYAFSSDWGYLTACPTNVGTGLRVSVMLHIPALAATKEGNRILSSISDMGYAVRGMYGEGSHATGAFYQISNETTLGQSEEEIVERIRSLTRQIVARERTERRLLIEKNGMKAEDKIFRSYGILLNARLISSREALDLLSWVSLGTDIGMLPKPDRTDIARLLVLTRPAHLQRYEGRELDTAARDVSRAAVIRKAMSSK